jgi:PAS domain S-box-containing protein
MKTKSLLNLKVQLAFGAVILTMLAVGAISYRALTVSGELDQWVGHTHEVLENLQKLMLAMQNVESSFRGMVVTGNESYLDSYRANIASAEQYQLSIRRLTLDNSAQQRQLPALERLAAQKIQFSDRVISLSRTKGLQAAADAIGEGTGQRIMDEFQAVIRDMQDEEVRLLALRDVDARRRLAQAKAALVLGTFLGLLTAAFAAWRVQRDIGDRKEAESRLRSLTERLSLANAVAKVGVWEYDPASNAFTFDATMREIYGFPPDGPIAYEKWASTVFPEDRAPIEATLQAIVRDKNLGTAVEFRITRADGALRNVSGVGRVVVGEHGEVTRVIGVNTDITERKGAEERLLESEERFRILVEGVQDYAIFTLDPGGKVVSWNAGAERIKGYKAEEIIGQNFSRFYLSADIDQGKPEKELHLAATNGRSEIDHWRVRKDGSRFWANVVITAAHDSSGRLLGFSEISRDISERKETEARYRGLLEAAPDAMVVVNVAGEIVLLNVQAEKQFEYARGELIGQQVKNIIPEGFAERLIADDLRSAADALAQQIGTGIELVGRRKDGSDFPIEIMLSPLESPEGILVTAAIRNISVRKDAEKHLAQMEGRYRGLLEAAPDAMVVVNVAGEIVLLNVQAEKQFGYRRDELVGQKVKNIIPEGFAERLIADDLRSPADALAQQIGTGIELSARRKDGSDFPIEIMLSPLESTEGILVTAAIRDITDRKKSELHLLKMVGELKRSNDELQQFAYVASHDLQEPLRMVASYTQLLGKRYKGRLDSDADEFIAYAVDGSNRMQGLIQDLLAYSRAGTNGKALHEISSEKSLKDALENLRATIQESGALVTHDSLPVMTTDDTQLTQVFQNLIGNAIKYRSAEIPRVHVSAAKNGGKEWTFSVRDNGLGIDPQYFDRIFVLFQRLHGREEFKGTGIGLTICKKIVERLGGRIWVESQPEKGSTFCFTLPERDGK